YGVWMESPTNAYVCGDGVHQWDGATWTSINVGAAFPARDVWGFGSADVWIVGEDGNARHWDGVTWATTSTGVTNHLIGIHGRSANDVYAVGYDGTILHWDGVSWTADSSPTTDHLMGVMALPGGTAWCVGYEGTVLHHDGVGWTSSSVGTQEVLVDVWAASDSDVWATGQNGGIYHWDGATWTRMDSGEPKGVWSVWGMSSTDIFFCGWDRVFHWDGSGLAGEKLAAQRFNAVHGIAANAFVTAGHYGKIYRFDGTMWSEEANPGLPTAPTLRIGEYNGVAAGGVFAVATWTGNDENSLGQPVGQQSVFDRFTVDPSATPVPLGNASSIAVLESGTPNPFRWITSVSFSLPRDQQIQCSVFDVRGRLVQELKRARLGAGRHTVTWDGRDESGATVSSGIYLFRMEADGETYSRKLTLVR
ncbi:MAG: T9SS type A sorting domain-containing protein, partial [Phycisphaerales bacterium]|nr:T9SS type A sorting domain-containing protein [Phycisphaerales bacterium]